uniref:Uncharacterized protein n=1 Tax=Anopheles farauti TaxID=69004 RepID=A0A182QTL2_9DIPT
MLNFGARVFGQYEVAVGEAPIGDLMDGGQVRHLVRQLQCVAIVDDVIVPAVVHDDRYGGPGQIVERSLAGPGRGAPLHPQWAVFGETGRSDDLREVVKLAERSTGREVSQEDPQHLLQREKR